MTKTQILGYILIVVAVLILAIVAYTNSQRTKVPIVFSEKDMLATLWQNYKKEYLEEGTFRTLDKQQNNITTSEGQSYTMLRAVWMDDKATFDGAYKWTQDTLKRPDDNLHSWLFGKKSDGTYGILTERGGQNSATDADVDIAVALLFASHRWQQESYLNDAKALINDIWNKDIVVIKGVPYLAANDLEKTTSEKPIINPSYLAPYAYRMFAKVDPTHDWNAVVDSSYHILEVSTTDKLDKSKSVNLPPDWVAINRSTGMPEKAPSDSLTTNYSYDALRTSWRIALDYQWNKEPRAKAYLDRLTFLTSEWENNKVLHSVYAHDGTVVTQAEAPAMYGGSIGYFKVSDQKNAQNVYESKLKFLYSPDTNSWKTTLGYYDDNWVWFGIGLYSELLPNLFNA